LWRVTSNWGRVWLRVGVRLVYLAGLLLIIVAIADSLSQGHGRILPMHSPVEAFAGLWFLSALAAYFAVKAVHAVEWAWHRVHKPATPSLSSVLRQPAVPEDFVPDPSRRTFFKTASVVAGAAPFLS